MKTIRYGENPGFIIPKKRLPEGLLADLSSFVESESIDREARATELSHIYDISVAEILRQLEVFRKK